jgi:hypothetical protein
MVQAEVYFVSRFDGLEHLRVLNFVDHGHCRHVQPWDSSMIGLIVARDQASEFESSKKNLSLWAAGTFDRDWDQPPKPKFGTTHIAKILVAAKAGVERRAWRRRGLSGAPQTLSRLDLPLIQPDFCG